MPKSKTAPLILIIAAVIAAAGIALYLSRQGTEAGSPVGNVATAQGGSGHIRGAADAPITLVEYGDYQCPTCGIYHPIVMELLSRYDGKLKLEYHHFPLISIHPNALAAAQAAEAAAEQGKFWEMHDLLYEHQQEWSPSPNAEAIFLQYALHLGLDSNRFMQALHSPGARDRVAADLTRGNSVVQGTPTFILNGEVIRDLPGLPGLVDRIDRLLLPTPAK
jgi:protein-disulfide isomerase